MNEQGTLLVVLYNKPVADSITLNSLMNHPNDLGHLDLLIWNNGPQLVDSELADKYHKKFGSITVHQDISNAALSKVYNYALEHNNNGYCVILDDDSTVSDNYISAISEITSSSCLVPILTNNGEVQSPLINKKKVESPDQVEPCKKIRAVGSGIVLGREFQNTLKKAYGSVFDERFLLYGVDATFFTRVETAGLLDNIKVIPGFEHSYSRLESGKDSLSEFRKKERAYDKGLRIRYYKSKSSLFVYVLKLLKNILLKSDNQKEKYILDAIITGKHYRDV
ncbi:glycosyltransferase family 2 protein [Vibrio campbellii]|uniref:glycosyltransferase family 2 protein n=1 Tax=Vibrio campbellii TaxID=680 RepID=UPI0005EDDEBC|nr:glycosyltransferase family A protein [Vibrio campbellii]